MNELDKPALACLFETGSLLITEGQPPTSLANSPNTIVSQQTLHQENNPKKQKIK